MTLAICIPTHHGRAAYLRELLDTIFSQLSGVGRGVVEICISDNASRDETGDVVAAFQQRNRISVRYFRYPQDTGIQNFANVVQMAQTEFCWLMGSDDVIPPGALARVMHALEKNPSIAGLTVNKLNFDRNVAGFLGPDHPITLPRDSSQSRLLQGEVEVMENLGVAFSFISSHVFRRELWISAMAEIGPDGLTTYRYFPHTFIFTRMIKKHPTWLWLADYCVIQRLDNFSFFEGGTANRRHYVTELTGDIARVWASILPRDSAAFRRLIKTQFFIYWNPLQTLGYKREADISPAEERTLRQKCREWFGSFPLWWLTTFPILLVPSAILRRLSFSRPDGKGREGTPVRFQQRLRNWFRKLGIENASTRHFDAAAAAAEQYLAWRKGS